MRNCKRLYFLSGGGGVPILKLFYFLCFLMLFAS